MKTLMLLEKRLRNWTGSTYVSGDGLNNEQGRRGGVCGGWFERGGGLEKKQGTTFPIGNE
jgi:hypothetical protein